MMEFARRWVWLALLVCAVSIFFFWRIDSSTPESLAPVVAERTPEPVATPFQETQPIVDVQEVPTVAPVGESIEQWIAGLVLTPSDERLKAAFGTDRASQIYFMSLLATRHISELGTGRAGLDEFNAANAVWLNEHADQAMSAISQAVTRLDPAEYPSEKSALLGAGMNLKSKHDEVHALALDEFTTGNFDFHTDPGQDSNVVEQGQFVNSLQQYLFDSAQNGHFAVVDVIQIYRAQRSVNLRINLIQAFEQKFPDAVGELRQALDENGYRDFISNL